MPNKLNNLFLTKRQYLLKKLSKRSIAIALSLIIIGWFTANPVFNMFKQNDLVYLYPYKNNNPVSENGLFWLESNPELGAYPISVWNIILKNQTKVIAIPEDYGYVSATGLDNLGQKLSGWITHKVKNRGQQNGYSDPFTYRRTVGDVTEEIRVPKDVIERHFKDNNDSFGKFIDQVKNGLTDNEVIKDTNQQKEVNKALEQLKKALENANTPNTPDEAKMIKLTGDSLMIGGTVWMLLKLLPLLAL
jgi:hypothetical protein